MQVVAYNNALSRSVFVCSDGVLVDGTPPILADVRAEGVRIVPGLVRSVRPGATGLWLLAADGVRHRVADTSCAGNALTMPMPEAFPEAGYVVPFSEYTPIQSPHSSTHSYVISHGYSTLRTNLSTGVDTSNACSRYTNRMALELTLP